MKQKECSSQLGFIKNNIIIFIFIVSILFVLGMSIYNNYNKVRKQKLYDSIHYILKVNRTVEYGAKKYNPIDLFEKTNGQVKVLSGTIDTMKSGESPVIFQVKREDVSKQVVVKVNVEDTHAPVITIKNKEIHLYVGDSYNLLDNISSVMDVIDGDIPFIDKQNVKEQSVHYYTVEDYVNYHKAGSYTVTVKAVDKNGNISLETFMIHVKEKPQPIIYRNDHPTGDIDALMNIAYSFIGFSYVNGGNSPSGFDCSGFVSYVYSRIGISLPRTSKGQSQVGYAVARKNMKAGDILIWSRNGSIPTHTAIYVGNGTMIHAANSRKGVTLSYLSSYPETLIAIRRI